MGNHKDTIERSSSQYINSMKTIGIIGGISWHSTALYYKAINELVHQALGGSNAAQVLLHSINYNDFKKLQDSNDWVGIEAMLSRIALHIESAGADCLMISCNAAHVVADAIAQKLSVPFLHIADATADEIAKLGISTVALIGAKFTMEGSFFTDRLAKRNIHTILPDVSDREFIHRFIIEELSVGVVNPATKKRCTEILTSLQQHGAEAVILGCTELGMIIQESDVSIKILDTTLIHCRAATAFALSDE